MPLKKTSAILYSVIFVFLFTLNTLAAESKHSLDPDVVNEKYGPYDGNEFDLWLAKSSKPTPLIVFIHGGGFRGGSKERPDSKLLKACTQSGISFASINYRLSGVAPYPTQMMDSARAVQFFRANAKKWKLDPERFAATGFSAGAGISLWLAFHNDLADPKNADPVLQQSTRLRCALVTNAQCTYDPREIKKIVPGNAYAIPEIKQLFGVPNSFNWDTDPIDEKLDAALKDGSPITHLSKDDPPVIIFNQESARKDGNIHHPNFGTHLKKLMDEMGIFCENRLDYSKQVDDVVINFFKKHLFKD